VIKQRSFASLGSERPWPYTSYVYTATPASARCLNTADGWMQVKQLCVLLVTVMLLHHQQHMQAEEGRAQHCKCAISQNPRIVLNPNTIQGSAVRVAPCLRDVHSRHWTVAQFCMHVSA
jgi:hypothetical protein